MKKIYIFSGVGIILIGLVIGLIIHSYSKPKLAGNILAENYDPYILTARGYYSNFPIQTNSTIQSGASSTPIAQEITGLCNLTGGAIAGFNLVQASCSAPGFVASTTVTDQIFIELASSTIPVVEIGASASTTAAGVITVSLYNATSTPTSVSAVGTSTDYLIIN